MNTNPVLGVDKKISQVKISQGSHRLRKKELNKNCMKIIVFFKKKTCMTVVSASFSL